MMYAADEVYPDDITDFRADDDRPLACEVCGSTETIELTSEDHDQSITVCAGCGNDEP